MQERYGNSEVHVDRGGLVVRRLEFLNPKVPTPVRVALTNRFFWLETGAVCVDIWEQNKIGLPKNNFENYHLVQTVTLDGARRGLYFDDGMAYRLWAPVSGVVLEIAQQYVTVQLPPIADAETLETELVPTLQSSPAGEHSKEESGNDRQ